MCWNGQGISEHLNEDWKTSIQKGKREEHEEKKRGPTQPPKPRQQYPEAKGKERHPPNSKTKA